MNEHNEPHPDLEELEPEFDPKQLDDDDLIHIYYQGAYE
jgi:hypothetical protein